MRIFSILAALWDFTLDWEGFGGDGDTVRAMDDPFPFPPKP